MDAMSGYELTLVVVGLVNSVIVLVGTALAAYAAYQSRVNAAQTKENTTVIKEVKHKTNSVFDEYLKQVAANRFNAGIEEQRVRGERDAAIMAKGVLEGIEQKVRDSAAKVAETPEAPKAQETAEHPIGDLTDPEVAKGLKAAIDDTVEKTQEAVVSAKGTAKAASVKRKRK